MVRIDFIQIVQSDCELTAFSATFAIKYCTKCKNHRSPWISIGKQTTNFSSVSSVSVNSRYDIINDIYSTRNENNAIKLLDATQN